MDLRTTGHEYERHAFFMVKPNAKLATKPVGYLEKTEGGLRMLFPRLWGLLAVLSQLS